MALTESPYNESFEQFKATWTEQRDFGIKYAMDALAQTNNASEQKLYERIKAEMDYLQSPTMPNVSDSNQWQKIDAMDTMFDVKINGKAYRIQFDDTTGSIKTLKNTLNGIDYINASNAKQSGLGMFVYQSYTEQNFSDFWSEYSVEDPAGCNLEC